MGGRSHHEILNRRNIDENTEYDEQNEWDRDSNACPPDIFFHVRIDIYMIANIYKITEYTDILFKNNSFCVTFIF